MTGHSSVGWVDIVVILAYLFAAAQSGIDFEVAFLIFFGLCAASFLPAYIGGLVSKRVTRAGARASMSVGMSVSLFWLLFIKTREASASGRVQLVNGGKTSLLADYPNWPSVDPIIIALLAAALFSAGVSAATQETETVSGLKPGADLRLRQVFIGNVGLNDQSPTADRTFQRYRGRIWGIYAPTDHIVGTARLMWEGRHYNKPKENQWPVPGFETWYDGGLFFDLLEVAFNRIGGSPLSVKLGRQEIILGNGWLVLEGTPIDGSRTIYFDAARATYNLASIGTTLDLVYLNQDADTGRFPSPLNGVIEDQIEQDETGAILYARNKSLVKATDLDAYLIYKSSTPDNTPGNIRVNNGAPFPSPPDSGVAYTVGMRAESKPTPHWALRAEGAYQWGTRNDADLDALGFNARATYNLNDPLANRFHLGYEFLSGNDPDSKGTQAFDPLWGRWPQWSELMIYQWPLESRVGEATNLSRLNLGWGIQVHPTTLVTVDYHALWADEMTTRTPAQLVNLSGESRFRGHLAAVWIKTKLSKHVAGHLVAEYLWPGDYYAENRRDESYFVRAELNLTW